MKSLSLLTSPFLSLLGAFWISLVSAEPVQYCKFGSPDHPDEDIDFCMGALMYQNASTNAHDMFLTMTLRRHKGSALGWTAIGPGTVMKGSLMFIVYGDPLSQEEPIVSIRTATGHHQPTLLMKSDLAEGMDLRVIRSSWLPDDSPHQDPMNPSYIARISLVCYSCHLWSGTDISAQSKSQPWIWAWNAKQKFDVFSFDAHLLMHKHHAGAGGWGNFYLDMSRSISTAHFPPSLPPIRPTVATLGASDKPMSFSGSVVNMTLGPGSYFHGLVLATAFLLLFPAGIIGLRAGSPKSFSYHWIIQICASILLLLGLGLGLLKSRKFNTIHQGVGIALASFIGLQGLLGWWHHRRFIRLHRRTWVSHVHIWLGRLVMVAGWGNIVSGLLLRGYKIATVLIAIIIVCLQAVGLSGWVFWVQRRRANYTPKPSWAKAADDDDSLALSTSDDENDGEDGNEAEDDKDETARLKGRDSLSMDEKR